jgi:Tfp pilus assembly protein PilF
MGKWSIFPQGHFQTCFGHCRPESRPIEQFETAVRIDPNDMDLHYNLGVALRHVGRSDEAAVRFEAASLLGGAR